MPAISDVELMEFADGGLDDARQEAIEAALQTDPELRRRLDAFLVTGKALARLFEPIANEPVPDRLIEAIHNAGPPSPSRATPGQRRPLLGLVQDLTSHVPSMAGWRLVPAGLAAGVACAALGAGLVLLYRQDTLVGQAPAALAQALETTPSDREAELVLPKRGAASLRLELSFLNKDGRYCRQYSLSLAASHAFAGYACRAGDGAWRIEMDAVALAHPAARPGEVSPAGREDVEAIERAVDNAIVGDPIEAERELALIRQGWKSEK